MAASPFISSRNRKGARAASYLFLQACANVSLLLLCRPGAPAWQEAVPRTVIRAESRLVLVDAVVRDKKGKLVRGLAAGDFRVLEDGKEQAIASLELESGGVSPEKAQKHYLLFLFDNSVASTSTQLAAHREAARFVNAWAGPDRYMAVVNFGGSLEIARNFTAAPEPLVAAIGRIQTSSVSTDRMIPPSDTTQTQRNPLSGRGAPTVSTGTRRAEDTLPELQSAETPTASQAAYASARRSMLEGLASLADSMASIRGRKAVALIGASTIEPPTDRGVLDAAIAACNRANVAVYVTNQPGLKSLADDTGGRVLANANDLAGELGKIAEEQDQHYLLGYVPAGSSRDCHALRVEVKRPGVDVRARHGYCTTNRADALPADAAKAVEVRAAAGAGNLHASMLLPFFYSAPNLAKMNVAMEISSANIPFQKVKGKPHAELKVVGIAHRRDGTVGGRFSDVVNLDFENDKEIEAFRKRPLHYEFQFDLPSGEYNFEAAYSAGEQNIGKTESPLTIEPWDGRHLAISALALARESRPVADLAAALDDSLLEDRRPLIARSVQIVPSGSNRFRREEGGLWYAEIYGAQSNGTAAAALQVRILDRSSGRQVEESTKSLADFVRAGSPAIAVAFDLPSNRLEPGAYRLEVKAVRADSGESALRTVDFQVEP